jgi:hypothetical protein
MGMEETSFCVVEAVHREVEGAENRCLARFKCIYFFVP